MEKHNHACEMTNMFSVSTFSSSTADFLEVRLRPRGAKWSLMGVLSRALSNKGNYSELFKLMDLTDGSASHFLIRNFVLALLRRAQ